MNDTPKNEYRIVPDSYGFEVQIRRWWFPFWCQCWNIHSCANTFSTRETAAQFAQHHAKGYVWYWRREAKRRRKEEKKTRNEYLGRL